jgi:hypothetical protein
VDRSTALDAVRGCGHRLARAEGDSRVILYYLLPILAAVFLGWLFESREAHMYFVGGVIGLVFVVWVVTAA